MGTLNFGRVELDQCSQCEGMWFDQGELKQVSVLMDDRARGFQVDPWDEVRKMSITVGKRKCPRCKAPMGIVCYPHPRVEVDVCLLCAGVWLDRDELNKILAYVDDQMTPESEKARRAEDVDQPAAETPAATPATPRAAEQQRDVSRVMGFVQQSVWDNMPRIREHGGGDGS
jgi:Zn-finger nucleic acid-binding protein